jgi:hypothetical protein
MGRRFALYAVHRTIFDGLLRTRYSICGNCHGETDSLANTRLILMRGAFAERLNQVAAIQCEPVAIRTPLRSSVIVKAVPEVGID